jgi:transposase
MASRRWYATALDSIRWRAICFCSGIGGRGDRLKILAWDRSGFWILYKRLEQGTFAWPDEPNGPVEMRSTDLALLLAGVDIAHTRRRRWYERVA